MHLARASRDGPLVACLVYIAHEWASRARLHVPSDLDLCWNGKLAAMYTRKRGFLGQVSASGERVWRVGVLADFSIAALYIID